MLVASPKQTYDPKVMRSEMGRCLVSLVRRMPAVAAVTRLELPAHMPPPRAHAATCVGAPVWTIVEAAEAQLAASVNRVPKYDATAIDHMLMPEFCNQLLMNSPTPTCDPVRQCARTKTAARVE